MVLRRDLSGLFGLLSVCCSGGLGQGSLASWHRGVAFERHRSHSSNCEEWGTKHPLWVPVFLVTWSRDVAPMTRGPGNASNPATPPGCRTYQSGNKCDTLAGSYIFTGVLFPAVFGTSCLDTRAKQRRSLRGFAPAGSAGGSSRAGISRQDCTATGIITSLL